LEACDTVATEHGAIAIKITTIVPKITTRVTIVQRIPTFWARSKNQCSMENGEEDEEFDKAALMQAVAKGVVEGVLKLVPTKGQYGRVLRARVQML